MYLCHRFWHKKSAPDFFVSLWYSISPLLEWRYIKVLGCLSRAILFISNQLFFSSKSMSSIMRSKSELFMASIDDFTLCFISILIFCFKSFNTFLNDSIKGRYKCFHCHRLKYLLCLFCIRSDELFP